MAHLLQPKNLQQNLTFSKLYLMSPSTSGKRAEKRKRGSLAPYL